MVIDECGQSLEIACYIPLLLAKKAILAGDHKQLPPTIKSQAADTEGLGVTLFDRMMANYSKEHSVILRTQYRMNESIMGFSSKEIYDGKLRADESVANHKISDFRDPEDTSPGDTEDTRDDEMVLLLVDTAGCLLENLLDADPNSAEDEKLQ